MAFSTPKQNPKCRAITNRTVPKSSTDGEKSRLRGSRTLRFCLTRAMMGLR